VIRAALCQFAGLRCQYSADLQTGITLHESHCSRVQRASFCCQPVT